MRGDMKIASIRIENFRSFADVTIPLNDYNCFVGPNGAGKSTVLTALNVFFRETDNASTPLTALEREDFHQRDTRSPIRITVVFDNLNDQERNNFSDYVQDGKLTVFAEAHFDETSGKAEVKQYGQRRGISAFDAFFNAESMGKSANDLRNIYGKLQKCYDGLTNETTKRNMKQALRKYEIGHPDKCVSLPTEDTFYGFSKANRLAQYVQWIYVPAVKDALSEQTEERNSALGKLLARTVRAQMQTDFDSAIQEFRSKMQKQYQDLLDQYQSALDDTSEALQQRLSQWAHPGASLRLQWRQDPDKSVRVDSPWARILAGEDNFEGELARFGHGFQRSYLLALLQELVNLGNNESRTLILACEEPELYQHPPQARHLADVFRQLSQANTQILVSTHNPIFVSGQNFEDVRKVSKDSIKNCSCVSYASYPDIAQDLNNAGASEATSTPRSVLTEIHQALQPALSEMFFTQRLILVEGQEDMAYLLAYFHLLDKFNEYRRLGCHIVPVNGKSRLCRPLAIAKRMGIPTYVVFDADANKPKSGHRIKHKQNNRALLHLLEMPEVPPMPETTLWGKGFTMWHSDIGNIVETDIGTNDWKNFQQNAAEYYGQIEKAQKHALYIGTCLELAWNAEMRSANLERLCTAILTDDNTVGL